MYGEEMQHGVEGECWPKSRIALVDYIAIIVEGVRGSGEGWKTRRNMNGGCGWL